jgi:hypothetical protein
MPLLRIDVIKGRSEAQLRELLDAIHGAMFAAFKVPERDRYQIVHEHPYSLHTALKHAGVVWARSYQQHSRTKLDLLSESLSADLTGQPTTLQNSNE